MKFPLKTLLDCWIKWNFLAFSMILLVNMLFAIGIFFGICKGNTLRLVKECVSLIFFVIHYSDCYLAKYRCFKKNMEEDVENWTKVLEIQKDFPIVCMLLEKHEVQQQHEVQIMVGQKFINAGWVHRRRLNLRVGTHGK